MTLALFPSTHSLTGSTRTLARKLDVPFSMSDCTPFTQAGYIGEDVDVCVHRLLAAANYDVAQAERGIICLDEIDKIAATRLSHGKDVGGEGVQQALLKILEGTTLQISARQERGGGRPSTSGGYSGGNGGGLGGGSSGGPGAKNEVYNVRTDDILFLVSGAFNGLNKIVRDRIGRGGMGFSQLVRVAKPDGSDWVSKAEEDHYKKHLPFFTSNEFNPLDLVEPSDLIKFGLIPELVGRIPVTTALAPLSAEDLVRVLTEPRNAVLRQFEQQLQLNGVELRCTTAALHEIARVAKGMETGARGLRAVLERLLGDAKHEVPGTLDRLLSDVVGQFDSAKADSSGTRLVHQVHRRHGGGGEAAAGANLSGQRSSACVLCYHRRGGKGVGSSAEEGGRCRRGAEF